PALAGLARGVGGVEVRCDVPDMRPVLHPAWTTLAPLRRGCGSPLKVLGSLAAGVPVVTTPAVAATLGISEGEGLSLGRSGSELAAAAVRILRDPELCDREGARGQQTVCARFD